MKNKKEPTLQEIYRIFRDKSYIKEFSAKYNVHTSTVYRWRKQGLDTTLEKSFSYCKTCNKFFRRRSQNQVLCGSKECKNAHRRFMSKMNGYQKNRPKKESYVSKINKIAKYRALRKLAVNSGKPITQKEINFVKNSRLTNFELAHRLGRSVPSIEGIKRRIRKEEESFYSNEASA